VLGRKFAWHILLLKRHADGSPEWTEPVNAQPFAGLREIDMGLAVASRKTP
jgi:hypothetical protein